MSSELRLSTTVDSHPRDRSALVEQHAKNNSKGLRVQDGVRAVVFGDGKRHVRSMGGDLDNYPPGAMATVGWEASNDTQRFSMTRSSYCSLGVAGASSVTSVTNTVLVCGRGNSACSRACA